jgi:hypothetical protein
MKKKQIKILTLNKLKISKIDFSEKIKGGSDMGYCKDNTIAPACPTGIGCTSDVNMGG